MPTLYSMLHETGNRNRILEMCKFRFWLVHWIDPRSLCLYIRVDMSIHSATDLSHDLSADRNFYAPRVCAVPYPTPRQSLRRTICPTSYVTSYSDVIRDVIVTSLSLLSATANTTLHLRPTRTNDRPQWRIHGHHRLSIARGLMVRRRICKCGVPVQYNVGPGPSMAYLTRFTVLVDIRQR